MRHAITFLLALLPMLSQAEDNISTPYQHYLSSIIPQPIVDTKLFESSHEIANGKIIIGFAQPKNESEDSKAILYIVLEMKNGTIKEIVRTSLFEFYTAGGRTNVETIEIQSPTRFSIQFNHRGACTAGIETYRFALAKQTWRVSGRDAIRYLCSENDESVGDSRTEWSGNFLTGRVVSKEYRHNKLIGDKVTKTIFPEFPLDHFIPFQKSYGPR